MAVMEIWNRSQVAEGRVALPSGENSIAEQFGRGLQNLGQAGAQATNDIVRADLIQKDNEWKAKQPEIAKALQETQAKAAQDLADIELKMPADLSGYRE